MAEYVVREFFTDALILETDDLGKAIDATLEKLAYVNTKEADNG